MPAPYVKLQDSHVTIASAGTRQQLVTVSTPCAKVIFTAAAANSGNISIGGATVVAAAGSTQSGVFLTPSGSVELEIDDLSKVWIDGTSTGDILTYSFLA